MRLYRILKDERGLVIEFASQWERWIRDGVEPKGGSPSKMRNERAVSTLISMEKARDYAQEYGLGDYAGELEVPDFVPKRPNDNGHVELDCTTSTELKRYLQTIHRL